MHIPKTAVRGAPMKSLVAVRLRDSFVLEVQDMSIILSRLCKWQGKRSLCYNYQYDCGD